MFNISIMNERLNNATNKDVKNVLSKLVKCENAVLTARYEQCYICYEIRRDSEVWLKAFERKTLKEIATDFLGISDSTFNQCANIGEYFVVKSVTTTKNGVKHISYSAKPLFKDFTFSALRALLKIKGHSLKEWNNGLVNPVENVPDFIDGVETIINERGITAKTTVKSIDEIIRNFFADKPENPNTENPDTENPDTENPDTENPDTENPDTENPDTEPDRKKAVIDALEAIAHLASLEDLPVSALPYIEIIRKSINILR